MVEKLCRWLLSSLEAVGDLGSCRWALVGPLSLGSVSIGPSFCVSCILGIQRGSDSELSRSPCKCCSNDADTRSLLMFPRIFCLKAIRRQRIRLCSGHLAAPVSIGRPNMPRGWKLYVRKWSSNSDDSPYAISYSFAYIHCPAGEPIEYAIP